jgi:hypothetical protein
MRFIAGMATEPRCDSRTLVDRHHFFANRLADVFAQWPVETIIFELLENVCAPAGRARNRKNRSKEIGRNP